MITLIIAFLVVALSFALFSTLITAISFTGTTLILNKYKKRMVRKRIATNAAKIVKKAASNKEHSTNKVPLSLDNKESEEKNKEGKNKNDANHHDNTKANKKAKKKKKEKTAGKSKITKVAEVAHARGPWLISDA